MTTLLASSESPLSATTRQPSERLRALLLYAKRGPGDFTYAAVAGVLAEIYHPQMTLEDAMHHLVCAYEEVLMEPRYEVGGGSSPVLALVLAPIKGLSAIDFMGARRPGTSYTIKQYYDAMANHIFGQLSITRVDWLDTPLS